MADLAFENAENRMVGAIFGRGLVIISCESDSPDGASCLYLVEREKRGFDHRSLVPVGSYDDLDTVVTIANIGYGIPVTEWETLESLPVANLPLIVKAVQAFENDDKKQTGKMENNQ